MATSEYERHRPVLRWHKRGVGRWLLKDERGSIWVAIVGWKDERGRAVQHQWRAQFMAVPEACRARHWTTGRTVASLKARMADELGRYSHAEFQIQS